MIYRGIFMAIIRPSADLRNHYKEISDLCKQTNQPIYITVNGREDTAIVSQSLLDELYETIKLMQEINEGLTAIREGNTITLNNKDIRMVNSP